MWTDEDSFEKPRMAWVKFRKVRLLHCLARPKHKDVVALSGGCYILFLEVEGPKEWVFRAVSEEAGEGVACLAVAHRTAAFAFAEKCMNPRIMLYSFPAFKRLGALKASPKSVE